MAVDCTPAALIDAAKCYECVIPQGMAPYVQVYLLQQIAGNTMTPSELANAARCYSQCIPPGQVQDVILYLLCQNANA